MQKINKLFCDTTLKCNLCGREIFDGGYFCRDCKSEIFRNEKHNCYCCGRSTTLDTVRCSSCNYDWSVNKARSAFIYDGSIKRAIHDFKFHNKRYLGDFFVKELTAVYVKNAFCADLIVGVPVTAEQKFLRSFNHSYYIAAKLAKSVGVKYEDALIKVGDTPEQVRLSRKERQRNLKNAFAVKKGCEFSGKRVLIVDDVLTTGATSHEIARILKLKGAKSVYLLTVASTVLNFD